MDPEDFPFGESKTVSGGMADLSTLYDPMSLDVDDVALIEDEDGSAQLSRLSRLAKTVETHIAMREMVQYGETMKPLFTTVDTMIEAATQVCCVFVTALCCIACGWAIVVDVVRLNYRGNRFRNRKRRLNAHRASFPCLRCSQLLSAMLQCPLPHHRKVDLCEASGLRTMRWHNLPSCQQAVSPVKSGTTRTTVIVRSLYTRMRLQPRRFVRSELWSLQGLLNH
jgi:hypothetical protein